MSAHGWSCYTSRGKTRADSLAGCLYFAASECLPDDIRLRKDMSDGDEDFEEDFWMLRRSACPAVLTENLFMDNREDVKFLLSARGKQAIIDLHVNGIVYYLTEYYKQYERFI